jgi:hypothetical protein
MLSEEHTASSELVRMEAGASTPIVNLWHVSLKKNLF